MRQPKMQGIGDVSKQLSQADWKKHPMETTGAKTIDKVGQAVCSQNPHAEEMPLQAVLRPPTDREKVSELQPAKNRVIVVDLPAAANHDEDGQGVDPMHDPDRQWVKLPHTARANGRGRVNMGLAHFNLP
jgi:hypothetical protein